MILRGSFFSGVLEMETGLSVLVPNRFLKGKNYKVAYLLHGLCGRSGDWLEYTQLPVYAENYNTIFIMPEVARSFYSDMSLGQKFFTYVSRELPEICKSLFHISSERQDTLVLGGSMGGYGALKCALSQPDHYGYCGAFSSACLFLKEGLENQRKYGKTEEYEKRYGRQLLNDFEAIFGPELAWKPEFEILELAKKAQGREHKPQIYMACGTGDYMVEANRKFEAEMNKLDFDFTYREWDGIHDWYFFNSALERCLKHFLG